MVPFRGGIVVLNTSPRREQLDPTDVVIVRMLYRGLGDAAIGRRLGIGHRTVQRRVHRLMERWNVRGRVALGARAQELGLLGGPEADDRALPDARFVESA
ncbi:LuxR C-terminal-related transcriptional regulator [Streptomyces sp. NPDC057433]|uniref:LuxR C-terminal-related transcriptional regulator n=1 Tax=Streptomyces sp. NPDC057433 TaxID=3346132 RepID=UPI0036CF14BC